MKKLSAFARTNWQPLALLSLFLTLLLLVWADLYGERQGAYRGDLGVKVMRARLDTAKARQLDRWNQSVARRWSLMKGSPQESEKRMRDLIARAQR